MVIFSNLCRKEEYPPIQLSLQLSYAVFAHERRLTFQASANHIHHAKIEQILAPRQKKTLFKENKANFSPSIHLNVPGRNHLSR